MSVEAPERIWVDVKAMTASSVAGRAPFFGVGYVRIDKLEELAAALRIAQGNTDAAIEDYNEAKAALAEKDKEIAALREAGLKLMPYLRWTIGPEILGHHPTMPSAVNAFIAALEDRNIGGKDAE